MKISALKLHSIAIADPPLRSSYGLHAPWALRTIVEIETDDGIKGVGETYGGDAPRAALEAVRERVLGAIHFNSPGYIGNLRNQPSPAQVCPAAARRLGWFRARILSTSTTVPLRRSKLPVWTLSAKR